MVALLPNVYLFVAVAVSPSVISSDPNIRVASLLAAKAQASRESGEIVRPFLLYSEAAKRDPNSELYRQERDRLASTATLLLRTQIENLSIKQDILAAEREAAILLAYEEHDRAARQQHAQSSVESAAGLDSSPAKGGQASRDDSFRRAFQSGPPSKSAPPSQIPNPPSPGDSSGDPDKGKSWNIAFASQILGYGTYDSKRGNSLFNPDNQLARFHDEDVHAALRSDFKFSYSNFSISAKPRVDYDLNSGGVHNDLSGYLQEWSARLQVLPSLTVSYGREVPMWGPAVSVPASNPWFRDNGRNTPLLEIGARDFGRIVWQPSSKLAISYIANTALRRGTPDFVPFRPTGAVKVDFVSKSILVSGIYSNGISTPLGQRKFIGGYFQGTVGQAIRLYVEGSAQQGNPGYYPVSTSEFAGYSQTRLSSALAPRTIVGGIAYTDPKAGTWTGEYIYNPSGYSQMISDGFYQIAQQLSSTYLTGGANAGFAAQQLALASNPGVGLLRRNYAFAQYQKNSLLTNVDVVFRYTLNMEDHGGEGVSYITWNTNDHLQLFGVVALLNGSLETEFARYLHYQAQIGFRIFLH